MRPLPRILRLPVPALALAAALVAGLPGSASAQYPFGFGGYGAGFAPGFGYGSGYGGFSPGWGAAAGNPYIGAPNWYNGEYGVVPYGYYSPFPNFAPGLIYGETTGIAGYGPTGIGYANPLFGVGLSPLAVQSAATERAMVRGSQGAARFPVTIIRAPAATAAPAQPAQPAARPR